MAWRSLLYLGRLDEATTINHEPLVFGWPLTGRSSDHSCYLVHCQAGSLSTMAHNVKIISANGDVTLRGPVKTEQEKDMVASKAQAIAGVISLYGSAGDKQPDCQGC
jgi:BON domain